MMRLDYVFCNLDITFSPRSVSTSVPLAARCDIIIKFFSELLSLPYKSISFDS